MNFIEKLMESEVGAGNKHYIRDFLISVLLILSIIAIMTLAFIFSH